MRQKIVSFAAVVLAAIVCTVLPARASLSEVRIGIEETGIYYVAPIQLAAALGMDEADVRSQILSSGVSLLNNGYTAACYVDSDGGIYFYGEALDSAFTDENAYRLVWQGTDYMKTLSVSVSSPVTNEFFIAARHYEEDNFSASYYFSDPAADLYHWTNFYAEGSGQDSADFAFEVENISEAGTNAQISLEVFSYGSEGVSNEHHIVTHLNSEEIGQTSWQGQTVIMPSYSFDRNFLQQSNTLRVTASAGPGASWIGLFFRSFDLSYPRTYESAAHGQLVFTAEPLQPVAVTGLATDAVKVVELGYKDDPRILSGCSVSATGAEYQVYFDAPAGISNYAVFTEGDGLLASSISAISDESLKDYPGAEYIIITHPDMAVSAEALASYRASRLLSSKVVYVDDIYNEFNNGVAAPSAIKDFLSYAFNKWQQTPKYVLLAGSGSHDYRNVLGYGDCLVPPALVYIERGLAASDSWYVDFDNNGVCEMPIGRLPVVSDEELSSYVSKVSAYETALVSAWHSRVILAADNPDHGGNFYKSSDNVGSVLPESYSTNKIYLDASTSNTILAASSNLVDAFNNGALFVNYQGHGGADFIAENSVPHLFATNDVTSLTNTGKQAIVTGMSCVMGHFEWPGYSCLGELLLMATNGGAISVYSPAGDAFNEYSEVLAKLFYTAVLQDEEKILGDAIVAMQSAYRERKVDTRVLSLYNLLGEPVTIVPGVGIAEDDPYAAPLPELDNWKRSNFSTSEIENVAVVGDYEDPDGDDLPNLIEYAFGRNPKSADVESVFSLHDKGALEVSVPYDIVLKYTRRRGLSGVNINVMMSGDLLNWSDAGSTVGDTRVFDDGNGTTETVELYMDCPDYYDAWFFRMKVSRDR